MASGPLGAVPGLVWDAERQRYFKARPVSGAAADTQTVAAVSGAAAGTETVAATEASAPLSVAQLPVPSSIARSLKVISWHGGNCSRRPATTTGRGQRRHGSAPYSICTIAPDCAVCLEAFTEGEKLPQLPMCGHVFHDRCLQPWLERRGSCPRCRAPVDLALHFAQEAAQGPASASHSTSDGVA
eukprot:gnl/TRDRNA2_/TRDRNA2_44331_c0_seq1.p1 gnl/TRDRNA2_/TRDRNA2_44331_c0~~gnl/TRDRNA2_/TRDRNA2_44331_c0_seq1.p1  ORF type:complete len:185 (-),score=22.95 gnl/TRDRNA2_/TRDRNA2_44331_c0_seq1:21-575(-)